ncbi:MAG: glycosyltransferase family 4 protein [Gallionella sp.]|nr:glycosyltransferase family 4 protein [Gallionella sp.]
MKVLIWTQYFWPENFHINAMARNLHMQGIEVTVLTGKPNYPDGKIFPGYKSMGIQFEEYAGFEVVRIPLRQRNKNSGIGLALNYLSFIASGYLFAPYALKGKKFDVIFVYAPSPLLQTLPAIYVAWLKRAPLVLWVQDIWPDALAATGHIKNRHILNMVGLTVRYIYRFSDSILIQSEGFRSSVEKWTNQKNKIRFYPNSAEDTRHDTPVLKEAICLANDIASNFSVVFAGNIGIAQSCETIIEAAKLLREFKSIKFYLVGTGSMANSIEKEILSHELDNIVMTGQIPHEAIATIYTAASALLLTLRADSALSSTIPSKLQGYLAAGKPVIACCNGEAASVVMKANAGISCPAGNGVALAKAISALYELSPEERTCLGNNAYNYYEQHYVLQHRVAELISHFKDIVVNKLSE